MSSNPELIKAADRIAVAIVHEGRLGIRNALVAFAEANSFTPEMRLALKAAMQEIHDVASAASLGPSRRFYEAWENAFPKADDPPPDPKDMETEDGDNDLI